jgi:hypothetical protein
MKIITDKCPDCAGWEKTTACPECGNTGRFYDNHHTDSYCICSNVGCKQEYYTDVNYCPTCSGKGTVYSLETDSVIVQSVFMGTTGYAELEKGNWTKIIIQPSWGITIRIPLHAVWEKITVLPGDIYFWWHPEDNDNDLPSMSDKDLPSWKHKVKANALTTGQYIGFLRDLISACKGEIK